jgi:hypothetical protein
MSKSGHSGGCQCGAVRYHVSGAMSDPHICHCRMCQKASGNYFMPFAGVTKTKFEVTRGEISWFHSSGPVRRGFCNRCGTPLLIDTISSDHFGIALGSLDDPASVEPQSVYGEEGRMPFLAEICSRPGRTTESDEEVDGVSVVEIAATSRQHPDHDTDTWPMEQER